MNSRPAAFTSPAALLVPPLLWAAHFLFCYVLAALASTYGFGGTGFAIGAATLIVLVILAWQGWRHWRAWKSARNAGSESGQIFYARTGCLLCALAALAVAWVALPVAILGVSP